MNESQSLAPYRLVIWGAGRSYYESQSVIAAQIEKRNIEVVGITADSLPAYGFVDGFPILSKQEALRAPFDYLLLCVNESAYDGVLAEITETYGIPRSQVVCSHVLRSPNFDFREYMELRTSHVSIVAPLCWSGLACSTLDLRCESPFRNMFINWDSYRRVLSDIKHYCSIDSLEFLGYDTDQLGTRYPKMGLDDVVLNFNHVETPDQAREQWFKRRDRMNFGNLFVMGICNDPQQEEEFHHLAQNEKRICFVPYESAHPQSLYLPKRPSDTVFSDSVNATAMRSTGSYAINLVRLLLGRSDYLRYRRA